MAGQAPSVLAVLVVKDGADWLRATLASLARQTYGRLGILAVDNASTDGSGAMLRELLGPGRVIGLDRNLGFPGAVRRALESPAAAQADYVLLLHDDTALATDAVAALVRAGSADGVGVVGPKVRDGRHRRVLKEIGFTVDRFGYTYSPLEEGEIDQGQHDSPREVLFVSSAAMLVARAAWMRAGPPDERLRPAHGDLDFCWRVRVAGFRVLMDPRAVAYHLAAGDTGRRRGSRTDRGRYLDERSQLVAMLKNYRLWTLLWVLPLYALQGVGKVVLFLLTRRFSEARQTAAAWWWALLRFPGTLRRRVRLHAVRVTREREVRDLMAPASSRLRRWIGQVSSLVFPGGGRGASVDEEVDVARLPERVGSIVARRPALFALAGGLVLSVLAFRHVLGASPLEGGALPSFPDSALELLRRYAEGATPGGFGGPGAASPALVPLGLGGVLTLGNPRILAWLMVAAAPLAAGVSMYGAALRRTGSPGAAVAGAASYALSAVVLWAVSEGRVGEIVALVALPWIVSRLVQPFERAVEDPRRWVVVTAIGVAVTGSFFPAVWIPVAITVGIALPMAATGRRGPALGMAVTTAVAAAVLAFPFVISIARIGVGRAAELGLTSEFGALLRLSPAAAPGSWTVALFLPVAGVIGLAVAHDRRAAWRNALLAGVSIPLAWLASAGYLPNVAAEPVASLGLAAVGLAILAAVGLAAVSQEVERRAFGAQQVAFVLLVLVVGAGVLLQAGAAVRGDWAVGEDRIPPAYPVVSTADPHVPFRVLWVGDVGGGSFPPPGGPPEGVVEARAASVRYGVTGRNGRSVLSIGLPPGGRGYEELERALRAILAGRVRHGGSLLAPFSVAYVVAGTGDLAPPARRRLDAQLDLLPLAEAGGLVLYRNTRHIPIAAVLPAAAPSGDIRDRDVLAAGRVPRTDVRPLARAGAVAWTGSVEEDDAGGSVFVSTEFDDDWRVRRTGGEEVRPFPAFGWALAFPAPGGTDPIVVTPGGRWVRNAEVVALGLVWVGALGTLRRRRT